MGATTPKAVINRFPQSGENQTTEAPEVIFDSPGDEGVETLTPNDSSILSLPQSTGRRSPPFFQKRLANKCSDSVLNIITNGYVLPFISKPNMVRPPQFDQASRPFTKNKLLPVASSLQSKNAIERVENVKSPGFYSRLFLVPKPCQRWRPVIDLSRLNTFLLVERFKMETPEYIDRLIRRLPSHPHPPKLKEVPMVLPQVTGVPVHLPSFQTGHSPTGLYNDCKGSEADDSQRESGFTSTWTLADQGPVSGRSPSEHSDSGRPDSVFRVDNKSGEIQTKIYSGVFVHGL